MVDYADIICQAVDEIVSKRLESINYDNTITCSIVDASKAKTGTYIVTDGSTNFTAYSVSTEYKVNDVVYVTIPNNDFRNQKIIIGKQVTKDTTPFIFTTPFDTIVDVSANLITGVSGERNLIANNPDTPPIGPTEGLDEYELHHNVKKLVWEKDFDSSMVVGFTRLGIQGQFRSWLKPYQAKDGDYGYHLILTCEKDNQETIVSTSKRVLKKLSSALTETTWGEIQTSDEINWPNEMILNWTQYKSLSIQEQNNVIKKMTDYLKQVLKDSYAKYDLYLSSEDMYGDPYNFQSFYQQEKVFDITGLGKIINMKLEFYQAPETFLSHKITNQAIYNLLSTPPYPESWKQIQEGVNWPEKYTYTWNELSSLPEFEVSKITSEMKDYLTLVPYKHPLFDTLLDPNLFEKDPYICVGYDIGSFNREQAILYTLDSSTYRAGLTDDENTKQVQLRWLHEFDDGQIKVVSNETAVDFEVRWYQYELGYPTVDGYSGVNWKRVNQDEHIEVDISKITTSMKEYYLIYHNDSGGEVYEGTYATGLKVPYKNGSVNTLKTTSISVLQEVEDSWLEKHGLDVFKKSGFIQPSFSMDTIDVNLDLQSWTNIFKSQMIYHNAKYSKTDSFTGIKYTGVGCLHRIGFWELFIMGYIMYQYCPKEYDLLRVSSIWKKGGDKNPIWTENYSNKNLYTDLGCTWPGTGNNANRDKIRDIAHEFANSFGEWDWYIDPEDNWIDYRPKDEKVYNELYAASLYLYEKTQNPEYNFIAPNFSYTFLPDVEEAEEKVKAVILYNDSPIYSNIITFENERYVSNPSTLDQLNGLNLWCKDNSYGNYRIYNIGGYLEDENDRNHIRDLECHFNPKEIEASGLLTDATWIMWRVPATGTMIQLTSSETTTQLNYSDLDNMPEFTNFDNITSWRTSIPFSIDGIKYFDGIWSDYLYDADTDEIVSIWKGNSANGFFINPILEYKIKSFYSPSDSNNTISCVILKNGVQYETQKEFTFGTVGNSGTDWSFEIDFDNNETALTSGKEKSLNLTARLYDSTNKDVTEDLLYDVDLNAKVTWKWHADSVNPSKLTLVQNANKKHKCSISIPNNTTINMNSLLYVECILEGVGDYALTAILPVPIRKWISDEKEYSHVTGATFVNYPSSGYPTYYNNPFKVHIVEKTQNTSVKQNIEKDGSWSLYNPHNEAHVYIGNISEKNILKPAAVYTQGVKQYGLQYSYGGQVCWTQPIFTMQNNYPSRAINEWNGKEIKMDYDKGIIMSPAMAAGKKNDDNTFSGVMLGDWSADDAEGDLKQQTGIYGFDHGAMSYAFKEDGTAFIGKSGFARIIFNGKESTIASESYTKEKYGMMIDLDDGFIDILGGHLKKIKNSEENDLEVLKENTSNIISGYFQERRQYTPTGANVHLGITGDPYFRIVADDTHRNTTLVEVSNTEYYLQTWDFNNTAGQEKGMKLDLMDTSLVAYNFTLESTGYGIGYDPDPAEGTSTRGQIHVRLSTEDEDYFFIGKNALSTDKDSSVETIKGVRVKPLIKINEDEFLLQSYNFGNVNNNESGMQIDLTNGSISAYNFTLESKGSDGVSVRLSTQDEPYFLISNNDKSLFEIGDGTFFMQSNNFNDEGQETGMYINLNDGSIYAYNFTLETSGTGTFVRLSSMSSPYFQIATKENQGDNLIYIGSSSYYLQSSDYSAGSSGMKIDLANGEILAHKFTLSAEGLRLSTDASNGKAYFQIDGSQKTLIFIGNNNYYLQSNDYSDTLGMRIDLATGNILAHVFTLSTSKLRLSTSDAYFWIKGASGKELIYIGDSTYYLQSNNYDGSSLGMRINLADGQILGYNFYLKATSSNGSIIINSLDTNYPLQIGSHFKIGWNGSVAGSNWSIDSEGVAIFGNWKFTTNKITNNTSASNYILMQDGAMTISSGSHLYLSTPSGQVIASNGIKTSFIRDEDGTSDAIQLQGTYVTIPGALYVGSGSINVEAKLKTLEEKINEVVAENKSLKLQLEVALETAEYYRDLWESHECPDPEPSGGGGAGPGQGTGGSE